MENPKQLKTFPKLHADKSFAELLDFLRDRKVKSIEINGMKLQFQDATFVMAIPGGKPTIEKLPELTDEQKKEEADKDLYWSAG